LIDALDCMLDPDLFAHAYAGPSWMGARAIVKVAEGRHRELDAEEAAIVREFTNREVLPDQAVSELVIAAGRGSGKSSIAALFSCARALRTYPRAPGERIKAFAISPTIQQSHALHDRCLGLLESSRIARQMVEGTTANVISMTTGVDIETRTGNFRHIRGSGVCCAVVDEAAFLPTDKSASPDKELLRALRPALARVPGSMLVLISTVYATRGELYWYLKEGFGKDPEVQAA